MLVLSHCVEVIYEFRNVGFRRPMVLRNIIGFGNALHIYVSCVL
jgi:hypothetical protein